MATKKTYAPVFGETVLNLPTKVDIKYTTPPEKSEKPDGETRAWEKTIQKTVSTPRGPNAVPTQDRQRYKAVTREGYKQALQDNAGARFHAGLMEGLSPVSLGLESEALEGSKAFLAGNIAGTMGQFAIPYAGVAPKIGKALSNVPKYAQMGKVGQAVARGVGTDLAVGVPLNTLYGVSKEGLEGKELAKFIGLNTAIDLIAGGVLEVIGGVLLKSGKRVTTKAEFDALPAPEKEEVLLALSAPESQTKLLTEGINWGPPIKPDYYANRGGALSPDLDDVRIAGELPAPKKIDPPPKLESVGSPKAADQPVAPKPKEAAAQSATAKRTMEPFAYNKYGDEIKPGDKNYTSYKVNGGEYIVQLEKYEAGGYGDTVHVRIAEPRSWRHTSIAESSFSNTDEAMEFVNLFLDSAEGKITERQFWEGYGKLHPNLDLSKLAEEDLLDVISYDAFNRNHHRTRDRIAALKNIEREANKLGEARLVKAGILEPGQSIDSFVDSLVFRTSKWVYDSASRSKNKTQKTAIQYLSQKGMWGADGEPLRKELLAFARGERRDWLNPGEIHPRAQYEELVARAKTEGISPSPLRPVASKEAAQNLDPDALQASIREALQEAPSAKSAEPTQPNYASARGVRETPFTVNKGEMSASGKSAGQSKQAKQSQSGASKAKGAAQKTESDAVQEAIRKTVREAPSAKKASNRRIASSVDSSSGPKNRSGQAAPKSGRPSQAPPKGEGGAPNTGNIDSARAKINYGKKRKGRDLWLDLRTQFTDDMAPLEKLEKSVRGKVSSAESSIYKQSRLYKGIPEKANLIIENELKPIIRAVEKSGKSYKDLGLYAEAVHARDVNRAGLKSGFTDAEIDDVIRTLGTPEMEAARKQLVEYSNRRLQSLVDADVITQSQFDAMRSKWKNYMPLNRAFDDEKVEFGAGIAKALTTGQSPLHALKGSDRQIIDPIESMIKNTYKTELAVGKNKIGKQLAGLAKEDTTGAFVRKLKKGEEVGRKNVVNIIENGQKVSFEVTPEVYKALKGLNNEATNMLIKVFQTPASVLRAGAVLTPEFAMRNPMRDVMQAFINSESGFNPITDFAYGLASYIKKGDLYQQFIKNNGGYGNIISMDRKKHKEIIKSMLTKTPTEKAINVVNPQTWLRFLRYVSDATESATKIGEFRAALRKGASLEEAAYRARDLMDFARAGSSVRQVNKVVAFLNANIQGKSKMIRAIQRDPLGVGVRLVASMAAPSVGAYALNHKLANERQKAQIKDAPTWLRDTFWLVAVPGTDIVARIPKPFEGAAVSNVVERFMDYMVDNDPEAFDGFIGDIVRDQSIPVMLSGITPIVEGMANYSFFRDAPLIPQREKYVERKDQQDIYTSETAKILAGGVEKVFGSETNFASPRVMDNTIKGLTAGLGTYVTDVIDAMIGKNKPAKSVTQLPILKAFTVNEYSTGKSMDFLYREVDRLTKAKNSNKETFDKEKELKYLNAVKSEISKLSKEIRRIQNDPKLSPEKKREKLNMLMRKRNDLAIKAVENYKRRRD
jgi:hypothetical protein